jgi:hypothetical protein
MRPKKLIITSMSVLAIGAGCFALLEHPDIGKSVKRRIVASGRFHRVAHKGEGVATVYQMMNGERVLCFTDFKTGSGEAVDVYLIGAADAFENETVEQAEHISLGPLKNAEGDQTYWLPAEVDLAKYRAVTIWSAKYRVNFTTAPLRAP